MSTSPPTASISRRVEIPEQRRSVFPGFLLHIDAQRTRLLHRFGWLDESDAFDDFHDRISDDDGQTWSAPEPRQSSRKVEGGTLRYAEQTAVFDARRQLVLTVASRAFYPNDVIDRDARWELVFQVFDPRSNQWFEPHVTKFGLISGIHISFSFPLCCADGSILIPAQVPQVDEAGQMIHPPGYSHRLYDATLIRAVPRGEHDFDFTLAGRAHVDGSLSSRGVLEPTIAALHDGRLAIICRGDNGAFREKPGHKWLSFSADSGTTWSTPTPLRFDDGACCESPSSGNALLRSQVDGSLHWIGNLLPDGVRANGNRPRSPLVIARVNEPDMTIRRASVRVIDERQANESEAVQLSNFRFVQSSRTGNLILFLTRFGENGAQDWKRAHHYRYDIPL